jgi:hypothetical protein
MSELLIWSFVFTVMLLWQATAVTGNSPPIAVDDLYNVEMDTLLSVSAPGVLANDSDPDSDPLTALLVAGPTNGSLTLNPDGSFIYAPNPDFLGSDAFAYGVSDDPAHSGSDVLFSDTFDRLDNVDVDASSIGMSGLLTSLSYFEYGTASIVSGQLFLTGDTGNVVPQHDFTDALVLAAGGFVVEFDLNPPNSNDGAGYADWVGAVLGATKAGAEGGAHRVSQSNSSFAIVLRGNMGSSPGPGMYTTFFADVNPSPTTGIVYDQNPTPEEWYHLRLTVAPELGQTLFVPGNKAIVLVEITGDLDANQNMPSVDTYIATYTFDWVSTSNYIVVESLRAGLVDDLVIRTIGGGSLSDTATVTINVEPPYNPPSNHPPSAADDTYSISAGAMLVVPAPGVLANDGDLDGDPLTGVLAAGPSNGTLALNPDGSFGYTPNSGFSGTDSFTYRARDGLLYSEVLFSDAFDRPDSADVDTSTAGMSGLLAPLSYFEYGTASVQGWQLFLSGNTGNVVPQHDFTDAVILADGGFVIEFDLNPPNSNDGAGYADWVGAVLGATKAGAEGGYHRVSQSNSSFAIVLRGNVGSSPGPGMYTTFFADVNPSPTTGIVYDQDPTADEWYHLTLTVTPEPGQTLFVPGNKAIVSVGISGDLDGDQSAPSYDSYSATYTFDWVSTSNYIVVESLRDGWVDDLVVRTTDDGGFSNIATVNITVEQPENNPPIATITLPTSRFVTPVGIPVEFAGEISDPDAGDSHTATWRVASELSSEEFAGTVVGPLVNDSVTLTEPGIYSITLTVTDAAAANGVANTVNNDPEMPAFLVVYDPTGGFVTGGGWIYSPAAALLNSPAEGKASFGFVAKYRKGATVPEGNTEFRFQAGDFKFMSRSYQWLVVAGSKAVFKGDGSIEHMDGTFKFMLTAVDSAQDKFRIKIWDSLTDVVIYDNKRGQGDDAEPTIIGGGSIVIHRH